MATVSSNDAQALEVAVFCYNILELEEDIEVVIKPLVADGYCYSDGLIEIADHLEQSDKIMAICHEMVHAKQYESVGVANEEEAYAKELHLQQEYIKHYT
jgi:predicted metallopeptidase